MLHNKGVKRMNEKINMDPLTMVSHEIRTPIAIINGNVENLEHYYNMGKLEDLDMAQILQTIKRNCARLIKMSNDMIDVMRMGLDGNVLKTVNFDIAMMLRYTCSLTLTEFSQKDLDIAFYCDKEKVFINGNPSLIERVILNLLSNAIKYSNKKCLIEIHLTENDKEIVFTVSDNGIGIPEDYIDKIFEPFIQVDSSSSRLAEGTGLGLSIVKKIIQLHQGEITVKSSKEGTTFQITIPKNLDESTKVSSDDFLSVVDDNMIKVELSDIE